MVTFGNNTRRLIDRDEEGYIMATWDGATLRLKKQASGTAIGIDYASSASTWCVNGTCAGPGPGTRTVIDKQPLSVYETKDKCSYCGQWGWRQSACDHCGAPID